MQIYFNRLRCKYTLIAHGLLLLEIARKETNLSDNQILKKVSHSDEILEKAPVWIDKLHEFSLMHRVNYEQVIKKITL